MALLCNDFPRYGGASFLDSTATFPSSEAAIFGSPTTYTGSTVTFLKLFGDFYCLGAFHRLAASFPDSMAAYPGGLAAIVFVLAANFRAFGIFSTLGRQFSLSWFGRDQKLFVCSHSLTNLPRSELKQLTISHITKPQFSQKR